jgi:hypothetical protein
VATTHAGLAANFIVALLIARRALDHARKPAVSPRYRLMSTARLPIPADSPVRPG